ncbi:MAG: tetratricopeptide repeat protein [Euryarchaeota archaeon]|nr:tetratricopeptide repeat protein [Euryarchaeota archaeon]
MSDVVFYRFQPDAMDRGTLERLFTGKKRKTLMKKLTKEIKTSVKNRTPRYYLIFGPRGVGKTHFVTLLYCDVEEQIGSALPVKLSEEEFSIYRVSDLLLRILELSKDREIDLSKFKRMSEDEVVVAALEELKSTGKMVVLFMENLNQILGEQMSKQEMQKLRSVFQTENIFTVVTTAPLIFPQVSEHEEPFFNFFEIVYLDELTRSELKELVKEIATIDNDEKFLSKMKEYAQKIDAVYILTGGSPRMAMLLYDLMSKGNLVDVEKAFIKLLDENTPYYQDIFRLLSGGKRKVFDTLIELGKPATPKEIAEKARLDEKIVNSQLRRLKKDGYVRSRRMGKTAKYEVRERLFRLWRELRRQPFAMQKLSILVEFLELWYSEEERRATFLERFKGLRGVLDEKELTEASYWFLSLPTGYKKELLPQIVEEIYDKGEIRLLDELVYGDRELKEEAIRAEFEILLEKGKYEEVLKKAEEMIKVDENDAFAWLVKGGTLGNLGRHEEALVASSKGVELDSEEASVWLVKGMALRELERHEEALVAFSEALKLDPKFNIAWHQKGMVLMDLERYEEALEAFSKAIELNPEDAGAWLGRGLALGYLERYEAALGASSKAVELNPKFNIAWRLKGLIHLQISSREFINKNYGNALENLNSAMSAFDSFSGFLKDKEKAKEEITDYFITFLKELIAAKNVEAVDMALNALFKKNEDLKELFKPISIAVEIIKSQDVSKYYELQVEIREIVADIVKKLTGSDELLPEEYRSR